MCGGVSIEGGWKDGWQRRRVDKWRREKDVKGEGWV